MIVKIYLIMILMISLNVYDEYNNNIMKRNIGFV